jgi:hypothetical protein
MSKTVFDCALIYLNRLDTGKGHISVVEGTESIPFETKRVFYLYDIPGGESRGAHAHKTCHQFLVAAGGAFEVLLNDGKTQRMVQLNRPYMGLHIPPGIWASEVNFSSGSICLVFTSHVYSESDYIRDYQEYLEWTGQSTLTS